MQSLDTATIQVDFADIFSFCTIRKVHFLIKMLYCNHCTWLCIVSMHFTAMNPVCSKGHLIGSEIKVFLLDKARTTKHTKGERSYHIFYQFFAGTSSSERESIWQLGPAEKYRYMNQVYLSWGF
jgi:hypothetical protein